VTKKDTLSKAYADINDELRHQYSIGYTSDATENRGFRRIHLSTKQKGLLVTTREGYYPG
jgi:hypothetical protein